VRAARISGSTERPRKGGTKGIYMKPLQALGYFCVALVPVLIALFLVAGLMEFCYLHDPWAPSSLLFFLYVAYLLFNIFFNYFYAVTMDPGRVDETKMRLVVAEQLEGGTAQTTMCQKCNKLRPPRAHHCKACDACVMLMDHHCPWINNCVGFFNRRHFLLFVFWVGVGILTFAIICAVHIAGIYLRFPKLPEDKKPPMSNWLLVCAVPYALSISIGVFFLFFTNVYLIGTGQTSIEQVVNNRIKRAAKQNGQVFHNQWNLGWRENFQEVFGDRHWSLWLVPYRDPPKGDGINYRVAEYMYKR